MKTLTCWVLFIGAALWVLGEAPGAGRTAYPVEGNHAFWSR